MNYCLLLLNTNLILLLFVKLGETKTLGTVFLVYLVFENVCRNDRKDTTSGIGGGLLIYAKDDMVGNVSKYESVVVDNFVQTSAVKVSLVGAAEVILVLLYRPHHIYKETVIQQNLTEENNEKLCDILQLIPKPYVMVGDLNYSNINWKQ